MVKDRKLIIIPAEVETDIFSKTVRDGISVAKVPFVSTTSTELIKALNELV